MMDPYYKVKYEVHKARPAYGVCCFIWMLFMATIAGFFGYYNYNVEANNQCYVIADSQVPVNPIPMGITEKPDVADVSYRFNLVINMFFIQSVTGSFLALFTVLAIFVFPFLLKFDQPIGILNKLNSLFGIGCMILLHFFRLSHSGKVCSGDFLEDQSTAEGYLLKRGYLLNWYFQAFWITIGAFLFILIAAVVFTVKSLR